jgi:hypothetical protein
MDEILREGHTVVDSLRGVEATPSSPRAPGVGGRLAESMAHSPRARYLAATTGKLHLVAIVMVPILEDGHCFTTETPSALDTDFAEMTLVTRVYKRSEVRVEIKP